MEALDPREMRKRIHELVFAGFGGDTRLDDKPVNRRAYISPIRPIIRAVLTQAQVMGWSGEDTMTALAFHALTRAEAAYDTILDNAMMAPAAPFMLCKDCPHLKPPER